MDVFQYKYFKGGGEMSAIVISIFVSIMTFCSFALLKVASESDLESEIQFLKNENSCLKDQLSKTGGN